MKRGKYILKVEKENDKGGKLLRYSMQLSMLQQLFTCAKISKWEYEKIKSNLQKDYGVVSEISTCNFGSDDV